MVDISQRSPLRCHQNDCRVHSDGVCLEGLPTDQCSHAYVLEDEQGVPAAIGGDEEKVRIDSLASGRVDSSVDSTTYYGLLNGEELSETRLEEVSNDNRVKLILIIGEPNSGKTTLLSTLYEQFHRGPFGEYYFAGTRTPIGYERRCHRLRIASGHTEPTMERTATNEFHFLHLSVRESTLRYPVKHLLFADIAGERFSLARDSDLESRRLNILKVTDHCFFVVDGEQLANKSTRHSAKQNLQNSIGRLQQNQMLDSCGTTHVLVSKWDRVLEISNEEEITDFFIQPLLKRFDGVIHSVVKLAAQPQSEALQAVAGMEEFFRICLSDRVIDESDLLVPLSHQARQFQKVKYRK